MPKTPDQTAVPHTVPGKAHLAESATPRPGQVHLGLLTHTRHLPFSVLQKCLWKW